MENDIFGEVVRQLFHVFEHHRVQGGFYLLSTEKLFIKT